MINWNEADIFKKRYESFCKKEMEDLTEEDIVICNLDRGRLIYLLNKFRPRPFDPEDRGTWPPLEQRVLIEVQGYKYPVVAFLRERERDEIQWLSEYCLIDNTVSHRIILKVLWWQPLPPVGKEGK